MVDGAVGCVSSGPCKRRQVFTQECDWSARTWQDMAGTAMPRSMPRTCDGIAGARGGTTGVGARAPVSFVEPRAVPRCDASAGARGGRLFFSPAKAGGGI